MAKLLMDMDDDELMKNYRQVTERGPHAAIDDERDYDRRARDRQTKATNRLTIITLVLTFVAAIATIVGA